jgi:hypothetical protein
VEYLDPSWSAWVIGDAGNYMKVIYSTDMELLLFSGEQTKAWPFTTEIIT